MLLVGAAYSNALHGQFVYDDNLEIEKNDYIQRGELFWTAMTSDVWAFKGKRDEPWSNYWRPIFVAWMALNYQLFGLSVVGWHVTSLLAHLAVTLLVFQVLLRLDVRPWVAAVVAWGFAAHPVHVESVAWASGIPDIIMSACLLTSYLFYLGARQGGSKLQWAASAACYGLALLCKEGAVMYPLLLVGTEWVLSRREGHLQQIAAARAARHAAVFFMLAIAFVGVRYAVLGKMRQLAPGAPDMGGVLATAPAILTFYLKQVVWPVSLGPVHGLRAVTTENLGAANFLLPLTVLVGFALAIWRLGRTRPGLVLGALWFFLPIALALDIRVFLPEHIVHDRYLYLPLMGALLVLTEFFAAALSVALRASPKRIPAGVVAAGLVSAVVWTGLTRRYNPAWGSNVALWERGIANDPTSGTAFTELGNAYWQAGRGEDAKRVYARAMELNPNVTNTHLGLGVIANAERRFTEAERYFKVVLERFPDQETAREQLALAYQEQGRLDEAIALFVEGRKQLPYKHGVYTENIAVLLAMARRTQEALAELESIREEAAREPKLVNVWYKLGDLYRLHGRAADALAAYRQFLALTEAAQDAKTTKTRESVSRRVAELAAQTP